MPRAKESHAHRNGEGHRTAQHGSRNDPGEPPHLRVIRKHGRHLIPAHVNGQNAAEHPGILPQGMVHRPDRRPQHIGEYRRQADDARLCQRHRPQQLEALLEFCPQAQAVAQHPVQAAQQRARRHNQHDDPFHRPYANFLSESSGGGVHPNSHFTLAAVVPKVIWDQRHAGRLTLHLRMGQIEPILLLIRRPGAQYLYGAYATK